MKSWMFAVTLLLCCFELVSASSLDIFNSGFQKTFETVTFYASYLDNEGIFISEANCEIIYNSNSYSMKSAESVYFWQDEIVDGGNLEYSVSCSASGETDLSESDIIFIDSNYETYYVDDSRMDDSGSGLSLGSAKKTIGGAFAVMNPGDTMIIAAGTYGGSGNDIDQGSVIGGISDKWTSVRAENLGEVVITSEFSLGGSSNYYTQFEGLVFDGSHQKDVSGSYVKILKSIFKGGPSRGNVATLDLGGSMNLLEDVAVFGRGGRYSIIMWESNNLICRRCIMRADGGWGVGSSGATEWEPEAVMNVYDSNGIEVQNTIAFDSIKGSHNSAEWLGGLTINNHERNGGVFFRGNLALDNSPGSGFIFDGNGRITNAVVEDSISLGNGDNGGNANLRASIDMSRVVFMDNDNRGFEDYDSSDINVVNSIVYGNPSGGLFGVSSSNIATYNPEANGYEYLPRVEAGSRLDGEGVGPDMKMVGISGTLYGEAGYNEKIGELIYDSDFEDVAREYMCDSSFLSNIGRTGNNAPKWCSSGKGLTEYIWEYLGNECPGEICDGEPGICNDIDGDGYGVGSGCLGNDCSEGDRDIHSNINCNYDGNVCGSFSLCLVSCAVLPAEICGNGIDEDCDGEDLSCEVVCENNDGICNSGCTSGNDNDCSDGTEKTFEILTGEDWRYFKGESDPGVSWNFISYDDSSWELGPSGFGYSDNDDATVLGDMMNNYTSVFIRKVFELEDYDSFVSGSLRVDFDDGFVAYVNGMEIVRENVGSGESYSSVASGYREAGSFVSYDLASSVLNSGENIISLVGYNDGIGSSDFSLIAELEVIYLERGGVNSCVHKAEEEPCDGIVDIEELIAYLEAWSRGEVSMGDILGAVVEWSG